MRYIICQSFRVTSIGVQELGRELKNLRCLEYLDWILSFAENGLEGKGRKMKGNEGKCRKMKMQENEGTWRNMEEQKGGEDKKRREEEGEKGRRRGGMKGRRNTYRFWARDIHIVQTELGQRYAHSENIVWGQAGTRDPRSA